METHKTIANRQTFSSYVIYELYLNILPKTIIRSFSFWIHKRLLINVKNYDKSNRFGDTGVWCMENMKRNLISQENFLNFV